MKNNNIIKEEYIVACDQLFFLSVRIKRGVTEGVAYTMGVQQRGPSISPSL